MGDVLVNVDNVSKRFCRSLKRSLWAGLQDAAMAGEQRIADQPGATMINTRRGSKA